MVISGPLIGPNNVPLLNATKSQSLLLYCKHAIRYPLINKFASGHSKLSQPTSFKVGYSPSAVVVGVNGIGEVV